MTLQDIDSKIKSKQILIAAYKYELNSAYGMKKVYKQYDLYDIVCDLRKDIKKLEFAKLRLKKINKLLGK